MADASPSIDQIYVEMGHPEWVGTAASSPAYHAAPVANDPVMWADIYLSGLWIVGALAFLIVFAMAMRGFLRRWGPSAILWGFIPSALGGALAAVFGGLLWPLAIFAPVLLIGVRRQPPAFVVPEDRARFTAAILRSH